MGFYALEPWTCGIGKETLVIAFQERRTWPL